MPLSEQLRLEAGTSTKQSTLTKCFVATALVIATLLLTSNIA